MFIVLFGLAHHVFFTIGKRKEEEEEEEEEEGRV
jgi:hypothetical protein